MNPTAPFVPRTVIIGGKVAIQPNQTLWCDEQTKKGNDCDCVMLCRLHQGITWQR